jgi:hypothetical protein
MQQISRGPFMPIPLGQHRYGVKAETPLFGRFSALERQPVAKPPPWLSILNDCRLPSARVFPLGFGASCGSPGYF